ncbi:hypothetical protein OIO90_005080 [Microbotryomycetes sp. JL221]|nr:hypothetical protein OIO90_005080 [Microbotryomycetes sp. JL221]
MPGPSSLASDSDQEAPPSRASAAGGASSNTRGASKAGRPRGSRGRGRGRRRGRTSTTSAAASPRNIPASSSGLSVSSSRPSPSPELAAPPSPELAAPDDERFHGSDQNSRLADTNGHERDKSSSLSEHSSRHSSPETLLDETRLNNDNTPKMNGDAQHAIDLDPAGSPPRARTSSVSSALSVLSDPKEDSEAEESVAPEVASAVTTIKQEMDADEATREVSSELSEAEDLSSAPASASKRSLTGAMAAKPRGRGRPRAAKRGFPGGARGGRSAAMVTSTAGAVSQSPGTAAPPNGLHAIPRATRANVTLPPGYIEGVTNSRLPKPAAKQANVDSEDQTDTESKDRDDTKDGLNEVSTEPSEIGDSFPSNIVVEPPTDAETDNGIEPTPRATPKLTPKSSRANSPTPGLTPEPGTDSDRPSTTTGRGGKAGRGRKGKKGLTKAEKAARERDLKDKEKREQDISDRTERLMSKRRKMEHLTVEQVAARSAARSKYLKQLDEEEEAINEGTHPVIKRTKELLSRERVYRLSNLAKIMARREMEFERIRDAAMEQAWRQWDDEKDCTRMEMYFDNHMSMRRLLNEEKSYPFLRDHSLLSNSYGQPLAPYFRAPVLASDDTFVPRTVIHAGHYVEPPPLNPALDHNVWKLSASDVEADLALLRDFDGDFVPPPPLPPQTVMPLYGYASPEMLHNAGYAQPGGYGAYPPAGQSYFDTMGPNGSQTHLPPPPPNAHVGPNGYAAPYGYGSQPPERTSSLPPPSAGAAAVSASPYQHMAFPSVHPPRPNYDSAYAVPTSAATAPYGSMYPVSASSTSKAETAPSQRAEAWNGSQNTSAPTHAHAQSTNSAGHDYRTSKTYEMGARKVPYWLG